MRSPLGVVAPRLQEVFRDLGFDSAGVEEYLGNATMAALRRGEPEAVAVALRPRLSEPLAVAITVFLLHEELPRPVVEQVLGADLVADLITAGVLGRRQVIGSPQQDADNAEVAGADLRFLTAILDVQPHVIAGESRLVFSDVAAGLVPHYAPGRDHVVGVGAASLSLLRMTCRTPVDSALDLGAGSGVQALAQLGCASQVTLTDVHPRALDMAEATLAAAGALPQAELLEGSWFEPVAGRTFDRIVANPPFVVGPPDIAHVYRDSGLDLDGATQLVVATAPEHLTEGGVAQLLGAWAHVRGEDWRSRIAGWLPDQGVRAWVLQRDVVDPALYVGTWLRDESIDPRSPEGRSKTQRWLTHFADSQVTAIGFGFIALQKIAADAPTDVLVEELTHDTDADLGSEVAEYFARAEWLSQVAAADMLASRFVVRPSVAKKEVSVADADAGVGFAPAALRLVRMDGPRWSHEVDGPLTAIVGGLHPQGLTLGETVELYAMAHGVDEAELCEAVISPMVDLVRHGLVLPAQLIDDSR